MKEILSKPLCKVTNRKHITAFIYASYFVFLYWRKFCGRLCSKFQIRKKQIKKTCRRLRSFFISLLKEKLNFFLISILRELFYKGRHKKTFVASVFFFLIVFLLKEHLNMCYLVLILDRGNHTITSTPLLFFISLLKESGV